ncbi:putative C2H2 finger domain protein [Aspergillus clavatus NRRL 1]|uniref:C2H2 finger domain protein, putative n=1 Tax=Aspergillus clavatus (strain ATCC 1007 / CBS 513.65 / DSM 816 / NCTC 3887 / NRRL 1 / QM 1276 / 107) TaxID=344612 RepID=A1CEM1_ASPCL|nr:C2H2 finger domain protein, putative [Aspergillus clavatus NRRL 1]EAW11320.1 C2H2 finger domain protein, putative [Aspergillus clavatus NRRL 1]
MSSLPYTCNTCLVAFRSSDAQRDHMRKDWHLYNMKRRIASLPPVSQETFNEKVLAAKATSTAAAAKASFEKSCLACQKTFFSENSYQNHVKSSKHKAREVRMAKDFADDSSSVMSSTFSLGEPINKPRDDSDVSKIVDNLKTSTIEEEDEEEDDEDTEVDSNYSPSRCLFCNNEASDIQENVEHMRKNHGMFIPEKNYLVDLDGLIHYLYRKINENSECLYCHAIRNNPAGIQTHMRDKGHCMIAFETEEEQIEIGQYYDFRSTYSDDEADSTSEAVEEGGVKVSSSDADEEGWETDASSIDGDEDDEELDSHRKATVVYQTEYELHLPSGKSVGHRSLAKYYRQNLHNYPSSEERIARQLAIENGEIEEDRPRGRNANRALITRANGGLGMIGASEEQKRAAAESERKERTRAIRQELRFRDRINRVGNNQKHFRDPLLQ